MHPLGSLDNSFAVTEFKHRHKQDFYVKKQCPVLNIVNIMLNPSLNRRITAETVHLRPAGACPAAPDA